MIEFVALWCAAVGLNAIWIIFLISCVYFFLLHVQDISFIYIAFAAVCLLAALAAQMSGINVYRPPSTLPTTAAPGPNARGKKEADGQTVQNRNTLSRKQKKLRLAPLQ